MLIKPGNPDERPRIRAEVMAWLEASRFTAEVTLAHHYRWKYVVRVDNVRLRRRKDYCGQHPNECVVNPFFPKPHRSGRWLEGADFVGFNDGLNDLLDQLGVDADVWSFNREAGKLTPAGLVTGGHRYFIRKGRCRRLDYDSDWQDVPGAGTGGFFYWVLDGTFEDYVGREAPRSSYPEGTPGLADWRPEAENDDAAQQDRDAAAAGVAEGRDVADVTDAG